MGETVVPSCWREGGAPEVSVTPSGRQRSPYSVRPWPGYGRTVSFDASDSTSTADRFLSADGLQFVTDYHLATLSTLSVDGTIHAVPVGFTYEAGIVRVITSGGSQKVLNAVRGGIATISQVDRATWLTLSGTVSIHDDAETVADAVERYAARYRQPRVNPLRVAMLVTVTKSMGSAQMLAPRLP